MHDFPESFSVTITAKHVLQSFNNSNHSCKSIAFPCPVFYAVKELFSTIAIGVGSDSIVFNYNKPKLEPLTYSCPGEQYNDFHQLIQNGTNLVINADGPRKYELYQQIIQSLPKTFTFNKLPIIEIEE